MRTLYNELFGCFDTAEITGYSHFVAMKGCEYQDSNIRLFVVGRAVNGWMQLCTESAQTFSEAAETQFKEDGFKWIDEENGKFFSRNEESKETRYFLSKSAFWRTIEQIWKKLYELYETVVTVPENARFFDYIAWSNLYKVAPRASRNPTDKMCGCQLDVCRRILKAEIDAYQPTHILLITDYDNWFANKDFDFSSIFADTKRIGSNYENKSVYVEGTAKYELGKQTIPVIITCRPESRKEKPFVDDVNNYFQICGE